MPDSVPARRTQEERTALSDQRMTDAAVALIVEHGIAAATLAAIGERAGYSRGLVTHRFGTKARLLAHLHDTFVADCIGRVQQAVGEHSGVEALRPASDALSGFIEYTPCAMRGMD